MSMDTSDFPAPKEGFVVTHFLTVENVERATKFYESILGGKAVMSGEPTILKIANSWVILNVGGGPTDDKPEVTLAPPTDAKLVNSFLNLRVADIQQTYKDWKSKGADFITPPKEHEHEYRCYMRDPDGYIIEVGQIKPMS